GAVVAKSGGLEFDDLRQVDFVEHGALRPRQPVRPRVQAGGEDHRLPDAAPGGVDEEAVVEPGSHRHAAGHPGRVEINAVSDGNLAVHQPDVDIDPDLAH